MSSPFFYGTLLVATAVLATPATVRAQAMQEWSAIEARPAKTGLMPATVAVQGPAAGLMPNAAQPAASARLKSDSSLLVGVLPTLTKLKPVRFTFLPGQGEEGVQYGLLPGDLARVYPELVRTNLMNGTQTINTAQLTPLLVEAIKELNAQLVVLQGQHLQLAEAYARLVKESAERPAVAVPAFMRRGRDKSTAKADASERAAEGADAAALDNALDNAPALPDASNQQ